MAYILISYCSHGRQRERNSETRHNCPTDTPTGTPIGNPLTTAIHVTSSALPLHRNPVKFHDEIDGIFEGGHDG